MGYGPSDYTKGYGWCWRNEHGCEQRMSPYFKTEQDCQDFHEYFERHYQEYPSLLGAMHLGAYLPTMMMMGRADLRVFALDVVNEIARAFEKHTQRSVVNWIDDKQDPWLHSSPGVEEGDGGQENQNDSKDRKPKESKEFKNDERESKGAKTTKRAKKALKPQEEASADERRKSLRSFDKTQKRKLRSSQG